MSDVVFFCILCAFTGYLIGLFVGITIASGWSRNKKQ